MKVIKVPDDVHAELKRRSQLQRQAIGRVIWELLGKPHVESRTLNSERPLPVVSDQVVPRVRVEDIKTAEMEEVAVQPKQVVPDPKPARCTHPLLRRVGKICLACGAVVHGAP